MQECLISVLDVTFRHEKLTGVDLKLNDTSNILQVLLARHRKHGGYYAVKVLQKQMVVKRREVHYLTLFTCPSPGASVCPFMTLSFHCVLLAAEARDG